MADAKQLAAGLIHFISAKHDNGGNWTACGKELVYPMSGNGWRIRDVTCPACDRAICDHAHDNFRAILERNDHEQG